MVKMREEKMMELQESVRLLGIELPQVLEQFSRTAYDEVRICDRARLFRLEETYGMLGEYYESTFRCLEKISKDPAFVTYAELVVSYLRVCPRSEAISLPIVLPKDSEAGSWFLTLTLSALMEDGVARYRERGFSEEEIYAMLSRDIKERIAISEEVTGKPGLDRGGFNWLLTYARASVFRAGIFNITPRKQGAHECAMLLRNRKSGEYTVLVTRGTLFSETEEAFIGGEIKEGRVTEQMVTYSKRTWELISREGSGIVGIHIPRGAKITKENILSGFREAFRLSRERYPEVDVRAIHCGTWMLDPQLKVLAGAESKLAGFVDSFLKYPHGGDATAAVYHFVFQRQHPESLEELPENTTLQRNIKTLYLNGGCMYITGGFVADDALIIRGDEATAL
jgi:hypothetical protein